MYHIRQYQGFNMGSFHVHRFSPDHFSTAFIYSFVSYRLLWITLENESSGAMTLPLLRVMQQLQWAHITKVVERNGVSRAPERLQTRSTQRAQTSLAEADHYSHIAHCKNVEPWLWKTTHPLKKKKKKKKKVLDRYLHHDLGMLPLLRCFFAHLLILQYSDHHQNLISSSLYYSGPVHKISSQSVHNFLSNVVHRQTDRQTN